MIAIKLDKPLNCQHIANIMQQLVHEIPEEDRKNSNEYIITMSISKPVDYLEVSNITYDPSSQG